MPLRGILNPCAARLHGPWSPRDPPFICTFREFRFFQVL
jgi:hypothetical protein